MSCFWDEDRKLLLITPDEYHELALGTKLTSINGDKMVVGTDPLDDDDTRFGHLAWGVTGKHKLRQRALRAWKKREREENA